MASFKSFSFQNVNFIVGGLEITGWAEGDDVLTITPMNPQWNSIAGAKGDVVRSQSSDHRVNVTAKILQSSVSNAEMTALYNIDKLTGAGSFPAVASDKETGELFVFSQLWFTQYATITRGQNVNTMEWQFEGASMIANISK